MKVFGRKKLGGTSLIEVLIAVFVVAVGILGTGASLFFGLKSEKNSEARTAAVNNGRELVSRLQSGNIVVGELADIPNSLILEGDFFDDSDNETQPRTPLDAPPFDDIENPWGMTRRIEAARLVPENSDDFRDGLVSMRVTVYWNENDQEKKVEFWAYDQF